jgi:phosphatidylserine/phosphatidylglycerophosphate/cardiolipin synthase-like enzyme
MERPSSDAPIQDWADYLADLLAQAKVAAGSNDADRISAVCAELSSFSEDSPQGATLLDRRASQAIVDLCQVDLGARLDRISQRDADFAEIHALIAAATPTDHHAEDGSYPSRTGNEIQILIDGQDAYKEIAAAFHNARKFIYVTISFGEEDFLLVPESGETMFGILKSRRQDGVDVRMVVWQPASPISDTIPDAAIAGVNDGPDSIQARWDVAKGYAGWYESPQGHFEPVFLAFPSALGCHHQKTYVMDDGADGVVAFVGGINPVQAYWDTPHHDSLDARRVEMKHDQIKGLEDNPPLHDIFYRITGPVVGDVIANFVERYNGASFPHANATSDVVAPIVADLIPPLTDGIELQVLRTIAPHTYSTTRNGDRGIRGLYLKALSDAGEGSVVYIENQYFFDYGIVSEIYEAAERGAKVIAILTSKPDEATLGGLVELVLEELCVLIADYQEELDLVAKHNNVALLSLGNSRIDPRSDGKLINSETYIHSKTMAVISPDGTVMTGGSANIAFTSMWFHSEMNIAIRDATRIRTWVAQLWAEHLQIPFEEAMGLIDKPGDALAVFQGQAASNTLALKNGLAPIGRVYDWHTDFPLRNLEGINLGALPSDTAPMGSEVGS